MSIQPPAANQLGGETSPYLLQHRDNPVHWQPWGSAAFDRARAEGKPVLLSIGYAACHWCHVMARESFEDARVAAALNRLVVAVKVDREERPDLDQIYQAALAVMGQQGGWPLTLFLTPDGAPFWGGTYFPPRARYGRPGFLDAVTEVAGTYRSRPESVARAAAALAERLATLGRPRSGGPIAPDTAAVVADRLLQTIDPVFGGIGGAPKFPQCPAFEMLWRAWLRSGDGRYRTAVVRTLTAMSQGGLYDHLGGGFARYATDPEWLVPHFEKMLYDNAQLIDLLTLVWQETGTPLFAERVAETVGWLLREMVTAGGAFAGTLDADSDHEEGRYYVWTAAEVEAVLGAEAAGFSAAYDVSSEGNWEGTNILNRCLAVGGGEDSGAPQWAGERARLLAARQGRVRPARDDKVLADWNGLAVAALARAGLAFERPHWLAAAEGVFARVCQLLADGDRLHHSWCGGRAGGAGVLDDYAALGGAALALFEATARPDYLALAQRWVAALDRHFWDRSEGAYCFTADDAEATIVRSRTAFDGATPSGNGLMVGVLARLSHLTGAEGYRQRADALVRAVSGELGRNVVGLATLLNQVEGLERAVVVTLVGEPAHPATVALRRAVLRVSLPDRVLITVAPGAVLPPGHPGHGKGMVEGRATAYLCVGPTCGPPQTEPDGLAAALAGLRH
ncbi:MAG: thioredoxin domain-containing protein [Rhodospirillaceae bacterium]